MDKDRSEPAKTAVAGQLERGVRRPGPKREGLSMKVYAVFKTAVYRHECGGVFSTLEAAEAAAERFIAGERDDHHDYEVVAFELDAMTPQTPLVKLPGLHGSTYTAGGDLDEDEALCTWSRTKGVVSKTPNAVLCGLVDAK